MVALLGDRLKRLREERRLTQAQVAERVGITKGMISAYEIGTRSPSLEILIRLSVLFGVTTDYLLGIDKKPRLDVSGAEEYTGLVKELIDALAHKGKQAGE